MSHPLQALRGEGYARAFFTLLGFSMLGFGVMLSVDWDVRNATAPIGLLTYGMTSNVETTLAMLGTWDTGARRNLAFELGFDYLYLTIHSSTVAVAGLWVTDIPERMRTGSLATFALLGPAVAWAAWLAGLFDAAENVPLFIMIVLEPTSGLRALAFISALLKLTLFGGCFVFIAWVSVARGMRRQRKTL